MKMELPDYTELREMAEQRPEQLEALRIELVENLISSAKEDQQRRLRGLQFQIDGARRTAGTPLAACIRISQMMHESLVNLRESLTGTLEIGYAEPSASLRHDSVEQSKVISLLTHRVRRIQGKKQEESALV